MLELLLACAPAVDPVTMSAIVKQESGGQLWVINDNNGKRSYRLGSKAEAVLKATELISAGHSIDMGLAQINSKNLGWLGLSVEQVFEPCENIASGAKVLENGYKKTGSLPQALSMYNTGRANSEIGRRYAESVFRHAGATVPAIPGGKLANLPALDITPPGASQKDRPAASVAPAGAGFSPRWF
jgi:type IV secretion system protein VirB1